MKIGQRALAKPAHRQVPLRLPCLTKVFDRPQAAQGGIEEGQQMGDHHIIQKQTAITVCPVFSQRARKFFQHSNVLAAGDRLRPVWQGLDFVAVRAHAGILRDLGGWRNRSF